MTPARWRVRWLDLVSCMSLGNLLCLGIWRALLLPGDAELYFLRTPGHSSYFVVGLVLSLALGAGLYGLAILVRRSGSARLLRLAKWGVVLLMVLVVNSWRHGMPFLARERLQTTLGSTATWLVVILALVGCSWVTRRWLDVVLRGIGGALVALSPLVLVTAAGAIVGASRAQTSPPARMLDRPPLPMLDGSPERRVVLVVFDSLDQRMAFEQREPGLALPAFDALRAQSIGATNAYPPSNGTWTSIPALLTGLPVSKVRWVGPSELLLTVQGESRERRWSDERSLFSRVRDSGLNSAIIGWAHPYCRVIGQWTTSCQWFPYVPSPGATLRESALGHLILVAETVPGVARLDLRRLLHVGRAYTTSCAHHAQAYQTIHRGALRLVADPRMALVVLHYPVPHDPYVWSRRLASFCQDAAMTYSDNLGLADRTLGQVRAALAESGLSPTTTLIVTSDHWQRAVVDEPGPSLGNPRHRVPFFVHLPGQAAGVTISCVFQTTLVQDLVLGILRREVGDAESVASWLRERAKPSCPVPG